MAKEVKARVLQSARTNKIGYRVWRHPTMPSFTYETAKHRVDISEFYETRYKGGWYLTSKHVFWVLMLEDTEFGSYVLLREAVDDFPNCVQKYKQLLKAARETAPLPRVKLNKNKYRIR